MPDEIASNTAPVADPPKPRVPADDLPPEALAARLEAAKRTGQTELLKQLGVDNPDQIKAALAALKAAEDAKKSDAEKLTSTQAELARANAALEKQRQMSDALWVVESAKLTPEQLAAVTTAAGDESSDRIRILAALRPTWTAPAAPASAAPPVSTTPNTPAPSTTPPGSPVDHKVVWEGLRASNPILAANYLLAHQSSIYSSQ